MIKRALLDTLKAIPALLLLGLGVWLALGIFFLFLLSGCTAKPTHPEWNSLPVSADKMYAKTRNYVTRRGGTNGKEGYNHAATI